MVKAQCEQICWECDNLLYGGAMGASVEEVARVLRSIFIAAVNMHSGHKAGEQPPQNQPQAQLHIQLQAPSNSRNHNSISPNRAQCVWPLIVSCSRLDL